MTNTTATMVVPSGYWMPNNGYLNFSWISGYILNIQIAARYEKFSEILKYLPRSAPISCQICIFKFQLEIFKYFGNVLHFCICCHIFSMKKKQFGNFNFRKIVENFINKCWNIPKISKFSQIFKIFTNFLDFHKFSKFS